MIQTIASSSSRDMKTTLLDGNSNRGKALINNSCEYSTIVFNCDTHSLIGYVHQLPEVQLSQFKKAISALSPGISHSSDVQLFSLNEAQAREGKPVVSPATFLDMNSIHLVNDPFKVWEERMIFL
ncbi:hypothetical protein Taro_050843 [Colocasia esculenta]|uniref:Uncharacterized protein n=1 Tax=Colocasia esculenta TaxID=4460 RepID=A0A843XEE8_COLES|nr:hypothetical protein [Colocasia esculenta]